MLNLTWHARIRMQQRGIPLAALECLLDYGRRRHDHHGNVIVFLDKAARRRLQDFFPRERGGGAGWAQLEKHLNAYAVIAEGGAVITVGHRYKRIRHQ